MIQLIYMYVCMYIYMCVCVLGNSLDNGDQMVYQQTNAEEGFEQHLTGYNW